MAELPNPVEAPSHIHALLDRLHQESEAQESGLGPKIEELRSKFRSQTAEGSAAEDVKTAFKKIMEDKFIALDQDKSQFLYSQIRATGATNVVEAGTSYGVSTIYLALAVGQNKAALGKEGIVIGTEHEAEKAAKARKHWQECGEIVEKQIDLREGDILETLKSNMPQVDMLLLDIWTPLALPTLKVVQPHLRYGALVFADNTKQAEGYKEYLSYMRAADSGFHNLTLPFNKGLEMSVYLPKK